MKGMKGKFVNKLKSIPRFVLVQAKPQNGVIQSQNLPNISVVRFHKQTEQDDNIMCTSVTVSRDQQSDVIHVDELTRDLLTDQDTDSEDDFLDDKENFTPRMKAKEDSIKLKQSKSDSEAPPPLSLSEIDISSFRRPDLDSGTLFDPGLLAAFQQAVIEYMRLTEPDPLSEFEEKCPPASFGSVVLYTTTLRGIRKTFDDCNSIRFLLHSFRVVYFERDVSMHMEFRQELWNILDCKVVPPKLFIKGRYIGGAEEVLTLHEQGKLRPLLAGVPVDRSDGPCQGCAGVRFLVCFKCSGSHKLIAQECPQCNENGLIICPYCC